jgi:hypothetical protein
MSTQCKREHQILGQQPLRVGISAYHKLKLAPRARPLTYDLEHTFLGVLCPDQDTQTSIVPYLLDVYTILYYSIHKGINVDRSTMDRSRSISQGNIACSTCIVRASGMHG